MENTANRNTATRGNRKRVSLFVRSTDGAIIYPLYLHARGGRVVGIALKTNKAEAFAVPIAEFSHTQYLQALKRN